MENIVLGKILKAMQKLSGLSVGELAEKADLTIDTVNNLFYARVQKPGFEGVCRLVECMGYTVSDLMTFMHDPAIVSMDIPQIMELIVAYTNANADHAAAAKDRENLREQAVQAAKERILPQQGGATINYDTLEQHNERQNELHEKQLDRFRNTHLTYVAQIREQYEAQLVQAEEFSKITIHGLEKLVEEQRERVRVTAERYERELTDIRVENEKAHERQKTLIDQLKKANNWLIGLLTVETVAVFVMLILKLI